MTHLFKVLGPDGQSIHGGSAAWSLPRGRRPGEWMPPVEREVVCCESGYHLVTLAGLLECLAPGCTVYLAEGRGDSNAEGHRVAYSEARLIRRLPWDERAARRYAADCAERVLPIWRQAQLDDDWIPHAIGIARRYADGRATVEELAAARDAALAARDAALGHHRSAVSAAGTSAVACVAPGSVFAWNAATAALWAIDWANALTAQTITPDAERAWQVGRLAWYLGLAEEIT